MSSLKKYVTRRHRDDYVALTRYPAHTSEEVGFGHASAEANRIARLINDIVEVGASESSAGHILIDGHENVRHLTKDR